MTTKLAQRISRIIHLEEDPRGLISYVAGLVPAMQVGILEWARNRTDQELVEMIMHINQSHQCQDEWEFRYYLELQIASEDDMIAVDGEESGTGSISSFIDEIGKEDKVLMPIIGVKTQERYSRLLAGIISSVLSNEPKTVVICGGRSRGKSTLIAHLDNDLTNFGIKVGSYRRIASKKIEDVRSYQVIHIDDADSVLDHPEAASKMVQFFKDPDNITSVVLTCRDTSRIKYVIETMGASLVTIPELSHEDIILVLSTRRYGCFMVSPRAADCLVSLLESLGERNLIRSSIDILLYMLYPYLKDPDSVKENGTYLDFEPTLIRKSVASYMETVLLDLDSGLAARMYKELTAQLKGQDDIVEKIMPAVVSIAMKLTDPTKPAGVFFFYGPSGSGKTYTGRILADILFGGNIYKEDMNLYHDRYTAQRLIGSPPGYVGYGDTPPFLKFVDEHQRGVIILDEMEKAHVSIADIIMEILDTGKIKGNDGKERDFRNFLIVMTSNICFDGKNKIASLGFRDEPEKKEKTGTNKDRDDLLETKHFSAAFLGRIPIICKFNEIDTNMLHEIVILMLDDLCSRLRGAGVICGELRGYFDECIAAYDENFGARSIKSYIETIVKPKIIADYIAKSIGSSDE